MTPVPGAEEASDRKEQGDELELKPAAVATRDEKGDDNVAEYSELEAFLAQKSIVFPKEVPFQYSFPDDSFYVCECYAEYYGRIIGLFYKKNKPKRGVTVTGTGTLGPDLMRLYRLCVICVCRNWEISVHGVFLLAV